MRYGDGQFNTAKAVFAVMRTHHNGGDNFRDLNAGQTAFERLFRHMRMIERAGAGNASIGQHDVPSVGTMIPSLIGMAHGDVKAIGTIGNFGDINGNNVGFTA